MKNFVRVCGATSLLVALMTGACSPKQQSNQSATTGPIWRTNPEAQVRAALARGDSQMLMIHTFGDSALGLCEEVGIGMNPDKDLRQLQLSDLGIDSISYASHQDSLLLYIDAYNRMMLSVKIASAVGMTVDSAIRLAAGQPGHCPVKQ